ncbi:MAG: iron-sulfur cluster assembly accessory protein [Elusimicrobia bacterium]|nr:iron-sulfur cluster assembly accessory protein [Elusimicrobiota bacterium]
MVTLSPEAAAKVKELLIKQGQEETGLRIFVKSGGCRGFNYGMALDKQQEGDTINEMQGIKVLVDPNSAPHLEGITIGYKDEMMGGGFTIENPNATSTCGCGQSFKSKDGGGEPKSCC